MAQLLAWRLLAWITVTTLVLTAIVTTAALMTMWLLETFSQSSLVIHLQALSHYLLVALMEVLHTAPLISLA